MDINVYINDLIKILKARFQNKLLYVGLQGSYFRGDASENSDIDIMVIFDKLEIASLDMYRDCLLKAGYYEKSCGFICGRDELRNWNQFEICHLLHSTQDYYGKLSDFLPEYSVFDVKNFVKLSANNLYHQLCHGYIHSGKRQNSLDLPAVYKNAFFILQNVCYLKCGRFFQMKRDMLNFVDGSDKIILENLLAISENGEHDFEKMFSDIFLWCKDLILK